MNHRRPIALTVALVALFGLGWGGTALATRGEHRDAAAGAAPLVVATTLPGVAPAASEPDLPSLATLHPKRGAAVQAAGPFDDRFTMTGLHFDGKVVGATVTVTSDVSEVLEFEALAGFYDARGALVGTHRYTFHLDEENADTMHAGPPSELEQFSIAVPASLRGKAVAAAVGVPVLVNE